MWKTDLEWPSRESINCYIDVNGTEISGLLIEYFEGQDIITTGKGWSTTCYRERSTDSAKGLGGSGFACLAHILIIRKPMSYRGQHQHQQSKFPSLQQRWFTILANAQPTSKEDFNIHNHDKRNT